MPLTSYVFGSRVGATPYLLSLVLSTVLFAGCDQAPGVDAPGGDPPILTQFEFDPHAVSLGDPAVEETGNQVRFSVTMRVNVDDPDGDLERVAYVVQSPYSGREPVAEGELTPQSGSIFSSSAAVAVPKGDIGVYTVLVYAVDETGSLSDDVRGMLTFGGEGEPPVIESVEAVPEVVRPPTTLTLIATVSDPDGIGNIARVQGTTPSGATFQMFDDGASPGDETAGDGRFTARFDVDAATPGTQTFTFVATDRSGLKSEVFTKDIEVE